MDDVNFSPVSMIHLKEESDDEQNMTMEFPRPDGQGLLTEV